MDTISAWRVRVIGSLLIAALVVAGYFAFDSRNPEGKIDQQVSAAQNVQTSLEQAASTLKGLPGPSVITLQLLGSARDYTERLLVSAPVFNHESPAVLTTLRSFPPHQKIRAYNTVVSDAAFISTYGESRTLLDSVKELVSYHTAVMKALENLLEYQPAADTDKADQEELLQALRTTGGGLEKTNARLDSLPDYTDETMPATRELLAELETIRKEYETAVELGKDQGPLRQRYIEAFSEAQQTILADRETFWSTRSESATAGLENARREFAPFLTRLTNL